MAKRCAYSRDGLFGRALRFVYRTLSIFYTEVLLQTIGKIEEGFIFCFRIHPDCPKMPKFYFLSLSKDKILAYNVAPDSARGIKT